MTSLVDRLKEACKPWEDGIGDPPEWDSPLGCVFDAGVTYAIKKLAEVLGAKEWELCDGSESYDGDICATIASVMEGAGLVNADGDILTRERLSALSGDGMARPSTDDLDAMKAEVMRQVGVSETTAEIYATAFLRAIGAAETPDPASLSREEALKAENERLRALCVPSASLGKGQGQSEASRYVAPPDGAGWVRVTDRLPIYGEGLRVVIYTEGYDFAGEQFFHIAADALTECDLEDLPMSKDREVAERASHWIYDHELSSAITASAEGGR